MLQHRIFNRDHIAYLLMTETNTVVEKHWNLTIWTVVLRMRVIQLILISRKTAEISTILFILLYLIHFCVMKL